MADYFQPTVVQQTIPHADMTPIEHLLLSHMFECEPEGEGWYFFSEQGPADFVFATRAEIEEALAASSEGGSTAYALSVEQLAQLDPTATDIEIDLSGTTWETLFQDIVKRSKTLRYVSVVAAFTCSRMRSDGFGGLAVFITADAVLGQSTTGFIEDCLKETGLGD